MELRKAARGIIDNLGPTELIKNVIEKDVAEWLSNPRLIPAVEARLKYLAAKEKKQRKMKVLRNVAVHFTICWISYMPASLNCFANKKGAEAG